MSNYKPQIHPGKYINTKGHWVVGSDIKWFIRSSNKKSDYSVEMLNQGFTCTCPARVRCKHISQVEQMLSGPM